MAVMDATHRAAVFKKIMAQLSNDRSELGGLTKNDLKAACIAIDNGLDGLIAAVNNSIPEPAKSELTASQKLEIFTTILNARLEVS